eukprot:13930056-Ditylum_brightwellii.AAC.1
MMLATSNSNNNNSSPQHGRGCRSGGRSQYQQQLPYGPPMAPGDAPAQWNHHGQQVIPQQMAPYSHFMPTMLAPVHNQGPPQQLNYRKQNFSRMRHFCKFGQSYSLAGPCLPEKSEDEQKIYGCVCFTSGHGSYSTGQEHQVQDHSTIVENSCNDLLAKKSSYVGLGLVINSRVEMME